MQQSAIDRFAPEAVNADSLFIHVVHGSEMAAGLSSNQQPNRYRHYAKHCQ